jgi:hypothetical protein
MGKMKELDAQIREIVREEFAKAIVMNRNGLEYGLIRGLKKIPVHEGNHWSDFESDFLVDKFVNFCEELAREFGRSSKSIACKTRRLMHEGMIPTWPKL